MDKLNQSLDLFTEGLRSDPEIRLDIRKELQSHLEEKIAAEAAHGNSNEESIELALKMFGSPVEVADGLAAANRRRMKLRARLRLLAGTLLIPAVIICAFFSMGMASSFSMLDLFDRFKAPTDSLLDISKKSFSFDLFRYYTPEQKLILDGDRTRKTNFEQQKAIWEKFPDNRIYAANYVLSLIAWCYNGKNRDSILTEIDRVSRVDPENALYNYLAAGILLKDACDEVQLPRVDRKAKPQYRFELKDRALLGKAMHEYLAGVNKKYCCSYTNELLKQRLQIMGEADSLPGQFEQMAIGAGVILPHLNLFRSSGRYMPEYAGILIKEGKNQEALQYLKTWKQFIRHVNSDSDYLITVLVTDVIARVDAEKLPPLYDKLGMAETAKTVATEAEAIHKPVQNWRDARKQITNTMCLERGSILANMLLPGLDREFTARELAPARYVEYVFCQKITLVLINLVFITGLLLAIGAALYWRLRIGSRLLLLSPPPLTILKILGFGVVLPWIAYFALSQIELLSGCDFGFRINGTRFATQMGLLLLLIPAIVLTCTGRYVSARCRELGVETPPRAGRILQIAIITGLALLVLEAFTPLGRSAPAVLAGGKEFYTQLCTTHVIVITGATILAVVFLLQIAQWAAILFEGRRYSVYYGAAARMIMLTAALAVLALTCVFRPVLDWREAEFIREDKIIFGSTESFTRIEGDLVRELKSKIDQAMAGIQK